VTDRVLPNPGEKIKVTGALDSIEIGANRLIVLREKRETPGAEGISRLKQRPGP